MRVAVVGAGSWGTTVASLTSANAPTVLWARRQDVAKEINEDHRNRRYLQLLRPLETQILERMDGEIDGAIEQRAVEFGDEIFLPLDRRERCVEITIATRLDADELDRYFRARILDRARDGAALRHREQRAPGA